MSKQMLAVALCRVSSIEQLESNSLGHQKGNVLKAAEELGAIIPDDAVWEGAVSSKKGVNFNRKDLKEIYEYCKNNKAVRYVIVQEVDRFMRSPDEQTYFYVKFWYELKVRIWFADKPELNEDTHVASLLRYMEGWRAAGSNEERQNKSINGQTAALKEGRYPFAPKPGYKKGYSKGIQEIHEVRGPILKATLEAIVTRRVTPSTALIEFNKSEFMHGHSPYKMDKFRKIVTDPFYASVVEIDKQVRVRNEEGLHDPLITLEQHYELLRIMSAKIKTQSGPRKNGNPKYPASNMVNCDNCRDKRNGRLVGFDHGNGKVNSPVYEKYRCRSCAKYQNRQALHQQIEEQFSNSPITPEGFSDFTKALDIVWRREEGQTMQEVSRIRHKVKSLNEAISQQVEAATDPTNVSIKKEILVSIEKKKSEIAVQEDKLEKLSSDANSGKQQFLKFAFDFIENMGSKFLDVKMVSKENRLRCKELVFPAGFWINKNNKVYTPEISPLYRLATKKKDAEASEFSQLVRVRGL